MCTRGRGGCLKVIGAWWVGVEHFRVGTVVFLDEYGNFGVGRGCLECLGYWWFASRVFASIEDVFLSLGCCFGSQRGSGLEGSRV